MIITGNRFEASLSPNKKFVDIKDRKHTGILTVLTLANIQELKDGVDHLLARETFKPFDLKHPHHGKRNRISGLNEEDARELVELLDKLEQTMVQI